jgi:DNA-binding HxlR family transcriptional regulator
MKRHADDYALTPLGKSLGAVFCCVWIWAETHGEEIRRTREVFAACEAAVASRAPLTV